MTIFHIPFGNFRIAIWQFFASELAIFHIPFGATIHRPEITTQKKSPHILPAAKCAGQNVQ
jgi:hypothetical protein